MRGGSYVVDPGTGEPVLVAKTDRRRAGGKNEIGVQAESTKPARGGKASSPTVKPVADEAESKE
jgi:hypothetical protein